MENPLQSYYRSKDIYVKLPTGGKWMQNPPSLSVDGEIGVRAMNSKDELLLNIPDALYNGQAIFEFIESVCPDIKDAKDMSLPDVDVIMLASRASSYDKKYPVEASCPHCETPAMFDIDLQVVLGQVTSVSEQTELEIDGLIIELKPNTLSVVTANYIKQSETARILTGLKTEENIDEQLRLKYSDNMSQIAAASIVLIADGIIKITMPNDTIVTDKQHIVDWLSNSNRKTMQTISIAQAGLNKNGIPKDFSFTCINEECAKKFKSEVTFNPSFFFTNNSQLKQTQKKSIA